MASRYDVGYVVETLVEANSVTGKVKNIVFRGYFSYKILLYSDDSTIITTCPNMRNPRQLYTSFVFYVMWTEMLMAYLFSSHLL